MNRKLFTLGLLIVSGLASAGAQARPAPSGGGGAPANPNAEMTSGTGKYANWDQMAGHQTGSLYFMGKVAVDGGQLPWDPIPVVVSCNGTIRLNTRTDPRGGFKIESAPRESEVVRSKTDPAVVTPSQLMGCEVRAVLDGFRSSSILIANASILDNPDIGTITLRIDERATSSSQSSTTATVSKDALKAYAKAREDMIDNHPDGAQHNLEKAVKADPKFAEAWYQLGKLQEKEKPEDAWKSFSTAAAADPQFLPPYEHIAAIAAQQKKWQDVVDATDHALKLDPDGTPQILYFSAVGNYNLGKKDVAETHATASLKMDPSHVAPNTEQLLAVILASKGDYSGALDHLRNCLTYTPPGPNADLMKQQIAQLEKVVPQPGK
jgi:cytochrome c-type biogenesis protein CcmH/NrfG